MVFWHCVVGDGIFNEFDDATKTFRNTVKGQEIDKKALPRKPPFSRLPGTDSSSWNYFMIFDER